MATNKDNDRIARYGNLVIYERSGVLVAEWTIQGSGSACSLSEDI
jgi:hypothetical protein